jgi:serine/threonine protein phosphatase PrpC
LKDFPDEKTLREEGLKALAEDLGSHIMSDPSFVASDIPPGIYDDRVSASLGLKHDRVFRLPLQSAEEMEAVREMLRDSPVKAFKAPSMNHLRGDPFLQIDGEASSLLKVFPGIQELLKGKRVRMMQLLSAGWSAAGRKTCQDHIAVDYVVSDSGLVWFLAAVFDGHGESGQIVARFLVSELVVRLSALLSKVKVCTTEVLVETVRKAFKETQTQITKDRKTLFGGSTATIVLANDRDLYCVYVGDSLCQTFWKGEITRITTPHNWSLETEVARAKLIPQALVRKSEIRPAISVGPYRIFKKGEDYPGLAMSRSFGDTMAHTIGVTSTPDIVELRGFFAEALLPDAASLDSEEKQQKTQGPLVFLGSDGLWDVIPVEELIGLYLQNRDLELIIREATRRWVYKHMGIADDISLVAIELLPLS